MTNAQPWKFRFRIYLLTCGLLWLSLGQPSLGQTRIFQPKSNEFGIQSHFGAVDGSMLLVPELFFARHFSEKLSLGLTGQFSAVGPVFTGLEGISSGTLSGGFRISYCPEPFLSPHFRIFSRAGWGFFVLDSEAYGLSSFAIGAETLFSLHRSLNLILGLGYHRENPLDLYVYKDAFMSGPEVSIGLSWSFSRIGNQERK